MARQGILSRRLAHCKIPSCSACLYGKDTKRAWRSKQGKQRQRKKALKPGEVISVDQMVSPLPGSIAQMVGFLMKQHYKYATVTEFRQPLQVQSHLEMPGILVQLGHIQRT